MAGPVVTEADRSAMYVIIKRGMYYRPNAQGYTSDPWQAGLWTETGARRHESPEDGVSIKPWAEVVASGLVDLETALRDSQQALTIADERQAAAGAKIRHVEALALIMTQTMDWKARATILAGRVAELRDVLIAVEWAGERGGRKVCCGCGAYARQTGFAFLLPSMGVHNAGCPIAARLGTTSETQPSSASPTWTRDAALEEAAKVAKRAGLEMTHYGPWNEGMRDMAVRIEHRIRALKSTNRSTDDE